MPTIVLQGGLGNQLFQYAVGRALSTRTGTELTLNASSVPREYETPSTPRRLHLHKFRVRGRFVHDPIDTNAFLRARLKLFGLLRPISVALATQVCRVHRDQAPQRFTPQVLEMPGNSFLYGYYQSERYFDDVRDTVQKEVSLRAGLSGESRAWEEQIRTTNSVAVHVRRGDYVDRGWQLPPVYYRTAIADIQSSCTETELFFFSDDLSWVRDHRDALLPSRRSSSTVHYVDCNDDEDVAHDLALMSHCRHNIIANSTLSWWGAWLNPHEEQTVLAPAYWIQNRVDDLDVLPPRWTAVDWSPAANGHK